MLKRFFYIVLIEGILFSCHPSYADETYADRSPVGAGCLSALIPGLGQFYNGDIWKGIAFMGVILIANVSFIRRIESALDESGEECPPALPTLPAVMLAAGAWSGSIVDAVITANRINEEKKLGLEFKPRKDNVSLALSYKF